MKILIKEEQYNNLLDKINIDNDINDFEPNYEWFDYRNDKTKNISDDVINSGLKRSIEYYNEEYKIKKVTIIKNEKIIGFLLFSFTTLEKEGLNSIDLSQYPIILSTAIQPEFRNKGLLKMMINKANIKKPFLVHTSIISPSNLWEKFGCKEIGTKFSKDNKIEMCQ